MASRTWAPLKPDQNELPDPKLLGNQMRWNKAKVVIRSITLFLGFSCSCLAIAAAIGVAPIVARATLPVSASSLLWNSADLIVMCVRRDISRGIQPSAHVGVDLILWLAAATSTGVNAVAETKLDTELKNVPRPYLTPWLPVHDTIAALMGAMVVLHFTLFVRACVEVDRRSKDRRVQQLIMAITQRGQDPLDYPLSTFTRGTPSYAEPSHSENSRDFAQKYNDIAAPVPEIASNHDSHPTTQPRELPAHLPVELPVQSRVRQQYPGRPLQHSDEYNEKVLITDDFRKLRRGGNV